MKTAAVLALGVLLAVGRDGVPPLPLADADADHDKVVPCAGEQVPVPPVALGVALLLDDEIGVVLALGAVGVLEVVLEELQSPGVRYHCVSRRFVYVLMGGARSFINCLLLRALECAANWVVMTERGAGYLGNLGWGFRGSKLGSGETESVSRARKIAVKCQENKANDSSLGFPRNSSMEQRKGVASFGHSHKNENNSLP